MNICKIAGCNKPAYGHGHCRSHYNKWKRGTLTPRTIANLPGERWADIAGHPGLLVSTEGRIKSTRAEHELLMKQRMVDGRMLVGDHYLGNITVHLAVLRAFAPEGEHDGGRAVFIDGDIRNCFLSNLSWETSTDRIHQAIIMAEASTSPWASAFVAFWKGDGTALNRFFFEMKKLLLATYSRKACSWSHYYPLEAGEYMAATLYSLYQSIRRGSLKSLDNLAAWAISAGDNVLRQHHLYAGRFIGCGGVDDETEASVFDGIGWVEPSAEMVAIYREELCATS